MFIFRWLFFLCFFSFIFWLLSPISKEKNLLKKINQIPLEDRRVIDTFFRIFLLKEGGAYTLFGDKPVSFDAYFDFSREEIISSHKRYCFENMQIREGWKAWEKYQHLFPSKRFILKSKQLNDEKVEIFLINKENFKKIMDENLSDFQSVIEEEITASSLLARYEQGNSPFFALLKKNHALLGILLGFGKKNARAYQERERIFEDFHRFTLCINPRPSNQFNTLSEERAYYENTLTGAFTENNDRGCTKFLYLPGFVVDPNSSETRELQKKYLEQRRQIHAIYSHGNFLETTLKRFCLD